MLREQGVLATDGEHLLEPRDQAVLTAEQRSELCAALVVPLGQEVLHQRVHSVAKRPQQLANG